MPEVLNLVFFKLVRSKTKFWQMIGRGTRLCPDLYAPGQDKKYFYIFDFCQNLEFFSQNLPASEGKVVDSLDTRLFKDRVSLLGALDARMALEGDAKHLGEQKTLREETAGLLHSIVANMTLENFIVRPKRKFVERYSQLASWKSLSQRDSDEISEELAWLPSKLLDSEEEAKHFDYLMLNAQLTLLKAEPRFEELRDKIKAVVHQLELQDSIPAVRAQMPLIQSTGSDDWWQDAECVNDFGTPGVMSLESKRV